MYIDPHVINMTCSGPQPCDIKAWEQDLLQPWSRNFSLRNHNLIDISLVQLFLGASMANSIIIAPVDLHNIYI